MGYVGNNNPCHSCHVFTLQILSQGVNELSILPPEFRSIFQVILEAWPGGSEKTACFIVNME